MKLTIIHRSEHQANLQGSEENGSRNLLQFAACSEPLSAVIFGRLNDNSNNHSNDDVIAIPQQWHQPSQKHDDSRIYYGDNIHLSPKVTDKLKNESWFAVANGKYVTRIEDQLLSRILGQSHDDVIAVNVVPQLQVFGEKALITSQNRLVGFRRFYADSAQPSPIPEDWPCYIFINTSVLGKVLVDNALPLAFSDLVSTCLHRSLALRSLNIGGTILNLEVEEDLLGLLTASLNTLSKDIHNSDNGYQYQFTAQDSAGIPRSARLFGKVIIGKDVSIGQNVTIVGPTIIGSNAKISKGAAVRASVIAPGVSIPQNSIVQNRILVDSGFDLGDHCRQAINYRTLFNSSGTSNFRSWSRFSYPRCFKRIADIVAALFVFHR